MLKQLLNNNSKAITKKSRKTVFPWKSSKLSSLKALQNSNFQVTDKIKYPVIVSVTGNIAMAFALLFIAPVPVINIEPSVGLIYGMITMGGIAYGLVLVSTFARAQGSAIRLGYTDDLPTYLLISGNILGYFMKLSYYKSKCYNFISGLWSSSVYLGAFAGPTIGGFLVEKVGFAQSCVYYVCLFAFSTAMDFSELVYKVFFMPRSQDYQSLN